MSNTRQNRINSTWILASAALLPLSGCLVNDANHNDKIRYSMAYQRAKIALEESGWNIGTADYDLMIFWRRHTPKENGIYTVHDLQLYDYLKKSEKPGPDRFVIAYDKATRKTYLRSDLRSNENLDALPKAPHAHSMQSGERP